MPEKVILSSRPMCVPDTASTEVRDQLEDLRREQIGLWQDLHEDSYSDELLLGDPTFNVIGWDSNYTGLPLPEADMREYVEFTVERIRVAAAATCARDRLRHRTDHVPAAASLRVLYGDGSVGRGDPALA